MYSCKPHHDILLETCRSVHAQIDEGEVKIGILVLYTGIYYIEFVPYSCTSIVGLTELLNIIGDHGVLSNLWLAAG